MSDFATLLRVCRVSAGLTQEALAERAGVTERSVRNIERGAVRNPRPDTVQLLGAALGFAGPQLAEFVTRARAHYWAGRGQDTPGGPAQLPMVVSGFTGRDEELAALDAALTDRDEPARPVVISAVSGTAGVGKTALALRWAHAVVSRFPDGQLYINLRGYDPQHPVPAGDALVGFLSALGVKRAEIPLAVEDRAALYRSRLHGRRLLVVLDNAASVDQVRPLLPGSRTCMTVVTSRDSLSGLVALHGARRIDLDRLPSADSIDLLRRVIGPRVDAEPAAAAALVERCARLPLALRVAGELAAVRPGQTLAELVRELGDGDDRLDRLATGDDERAAVRQVFSWSYRHLPDAAAALFRVVGLHPGVDFDGYAAAALAGTSVEAAEEALALLLRAHLVEVTATGRYALHDLLRAYASSLVPAGDRAAALTGLFDHYLATAAAAMDVLHPAERHRRPRVDPAGSPVPPLHDGEAACAWLDGELPNLVVMTGHAADHDWPGHAVRLAATLYRFLSGDHFISGLSIHRDAARAGRRSGDRGGEAEALANLGVTYWLLDRYDEAADHLLRAIVLHSETGDRVEEARALNNLALVYQWAGDLHRAAAYLEEALPLHHANGDRGGAAKTVGNLGTLYWNLGRHTEADRHLSEALAIHSELGDEFGEATNRNGLGLVQMSLGDYDAAIAHFERGLELYRRLGHRAGEGHTLSNLGDVDTRRGRFAEAAERHRTAIQIFQQSGDRAGEINASIGLGTALCRTGAVEPARDLFTAALGMAEGIGARREQALAHEELARLCETTGDPAAAREHWESALRFFSEFDPAKAAEINAHLG